MAFQKTYTFLAVLLAASISSSAFIAPSPSFTANTKSSLGAYTNGDTGITTSPAIPIARRGNVCKQNLPPSSMPNGGSITMVGSGPGDPDLLTMAAHKILADPDALVISDRLVSKEILDLIQGEYKIARKLPGCADAAQDEIYKWCKEGLDAGKRVVRLKIGDPFVFGRGGEEVLKFREFGVEPKVIPGVSAAFSAPLLGSIPVTHRGVSNQVVMCTGYGRNGTSPDLIQYHREQTIVFLMAVGRLRELCQRLINMAGYPSDTPVGIIQDAGCPTQRTVVGTMETIADIAVEYEIKAPSTIVVGEVVRVLLEDNSETGEQVVGLIQNMTASEV
mmetsp:Transcript_14060/g.21053  ORF Transcript_14060/g.21053 Transcript_14060/m.21053 type:complete len:333 (+) Transcript_14060:77-1075(+)